MFDLAPPPSAASKPELYRSVAQQLSGLIAGEADAVANAANMAALIFGALPDLNWAGFYFLKDRSELVLGPFQGKPACVRIPVGRGVCGTAAATKTSVIVPDVRRIPGAYRLRRRLALGARGAPRSRRSGSRRPRSRQPPPVPLRRRGPGGVRGAGAPLSGGLDAVTRPSPVEDRSAASAVNRVPVRRTFL